MKNLDWDHVQALMDDIFPAFCAVPFHFLTQSYFKEKSMYRYKQ